MSATGIISPPHLRAFIISNRILLILALLTIVWGAFVRISGAGDGCGEHWPLCKGTIVPDLFSGGSLETFIEFFHRIKSALFGLGTLILMTLAFKWFPKNHPTRKASIWLVGFTISEALFGAILVLLRLVDTNASLWRVWAMSFHLLNTFALVASIVAVEISAVHNRCNLPNAQKFYIAGGIILLFALTGSWAALSTTLEPSSSLWGGISKDLDANTPLLHRLRVLHPVIALGIAWLVPYLVKPANTGESGFMYKDWKLFTSTFVFQIFLGALTLLLLSPLPLKLLHLLFAQLSWIFFQRIVWKCS